jgi:hypothetical protein
MWSLGVSVTTPNNESGTLQAPKPRYRRIIDRFECPQCGETLGQRFGTGFEDIRLYTDTNPIVPPGPLKREFHPCGCVDFVFPEVVPNA